MAVAERPGIVPVASDELGTELVARARTRARTRLLGRDGAVAAALAALFAVAAGGCLVLLPAVRPFSPVAAAVAVLAYALVSRVQFEVGNGLVTPGELVLVPMLLALPPRAVPLLVAAGLVLAQAPGLLRRTVPPSHLPILVANASHALGPALVLGLGGAGRPRWHDAPLYLGALASQFGGELLVGATWSRAAWGIPVRLHAASTPVPMLVDATLGVVALAAAIGAGGSVWTVLAVLPLVALLEVFARERQVRIDHALELGQAYRGTALLLGDVIEADDAYTGSHSRDVVELVLAVADRLGLDPAARRQAEFAALLHDVGKVKIPAEIIGKPGPLDAAERAVMNTHTLVGEEMLETIGGLLGDVGRIVRSCHERWDGDGYPDGLAGEAIPLTARIVCACDAWSAMTTDRPYRRARPPGEAADELRRCAGTHFDPAVVDALLAVLAK